MMFHPLKNKTKTFLVLQNIFYSLSMKVSIYCQIVDGGIQRVSTNFLILRFISPQISSSVLIKTYAEIYERRTLRSETIFDN